MKFLDFILLAGLGQSEFHCPAGSARLQNATATAGKKKGEVDAIFNYQPTLPTNKEIFLKICYLAYLQSFYKTTSWWLETPGTFWRFQF